MKYGSIHKLSLQETNLILLLYRGLNLTLFTYGLIPVLYGLLLVLAIDDCLVDKGNRDECGVLCVAK